MRRRLAPFEWGATGVGAGSAEMANGPARSAGTSLWNPHCMQVTNEPYWSRSSNRSPVQRGQSLNQNMATSCCASPQAPWIGPLFLFFQPRLSSLNLLGRAGSSWNFVVACQLRYRFSSELHYGHLWRATRGLAPKQLGVIHPIPVGKLAKAGARSKSVSIQWTGQWSGSEGVIDGGLGRCAHPLSVCRSGVQSLCSNR